MRINVYNEELTDRVEFRPKTVEKTGNKFYGLHFFLASPDKLHQNENDDDSSAVILWSESPEQTLSLLSKATEEVQRFINSK